MARTSAQLNANGLRIMANSPPMPEDRTAFDWIASRKDATFAGARRAASPASLRTRTHNDQPRARRQRPIAIPLVLPDERRCAFLRFARGPAVQRQQISPRHG